MKIFVNGLQRSGTNYTKQLLHLNTNLDVHDWRNPYWKHDLYNNIKPDCDEVICVIKNPYTWIESVCFRNCVDIKKMYSSLYSDSNFIGNFNINLVELCQLYKNFYTNWINFGVKLVHYENLLNIDYIKLFLNNNYKNYVVRFEIPKNINFSKDFKLNDIDKYKNNRTFFLNEKHIKTINSILDKNFFDLIQYDQMIKT
jgi:hypothetical protein